MPSGAREFFPVNNTLQWSWEKEKNFIFKRHKLNTTLIFQDNAKESRPDFTDLYRLERDPRERCKDIDVSIEMLCDGNQEQFWIGKMAAIDGDWNVSFCNTSIKPRVDDRYSCLVNKYEQKVNILRNTETVTASPFVGMIEYITCYYTEQGGISKYINENYSGLPFAACIDGNMSDEGWTLFINQGLWEEGDGTENFGTWSIETTWVREFVSNDQDLIGEGWIQVDGGYARLVPVAPKQRYNENGQFLEEFELPFPEAGFDNGVPLQVALEKILEVLECEDINIISNFFNINPDGTNPDNSAYQAAEIYLRELVIYQRTDIKRAQANQNATRNELSLKDIFDDFENMFNVYWDVDDDDNWRIEHISYFNSERRLNLLEPMFEEKIRHQWRYKYDTEKLPEQEVWNWPIPQTYHFNGLPILYTGACVTDNENEKEKKFPIKNFLTDIEFILQANDEDIENEGSVLVATSDGFIISETNKWTGDYKLNGHLAIPNLQHYYHQHNRPQFEGEMNEELTVFETIIRTRRQTIKITFACCDMLLFNPNDLVKTQLGWGEIDRATYDEPKQELTLELLHD